MVKKTVPVVEKRFHFEFYIKIIPDTFCFICCNFLIIREEFSILPAVIERKRRKFKKSLFIHAGFHKSLQFLSAGFEALYHLPSKKEIEVKCLDPFRSKLI